MSSPNPLDHSDDGWVIMGKIVAETNKLVDLKRELEISGQALNDAKGKHSQVKSRIDTQKWVINSLKFQQKAEGSHL